MEWRKNRFVRQELEPIHFTEEEKVLFVDLHNKYRGSNLTPPAADMQYLEWDETLEKVAQDWADKCIFDHGNTKHPNVKGPMGQNLYFGFTRHPNRAVTKWFEEYVDYDYHNLYCQPNKKCGHYTQIVWANTRYVGCALKVNCNKIYKYYVVCNYYPVGNVKGVHPYKEGLSCSKCSKNNEGYCSDKLCVTKSQCEKHKLKCDCNLNCYNCGTLNKEKCTCQCKDGWDELDCSVPCVDQNSNCGEYICSYYDTHNYLINPCRKACRFCKTVDKTNLSNTCCDGKMCSDGYVLNVNSCSCYLLNQGLQSNDATSTLTTVLIVIITLTVIIIVIP